MSRSATATLTALGVGAAGELTTAPARTLPVRGELAGLLPWGGLRRGSTVSVRGSTSLLLALMAAATAEGCWAAVVGLPGCGALAAAELGVAVHRLALVPRPGGDQGEVEKTVAALLDGFDLVALATPVTAVTSRKLTARARHRKAVLLPFTVSWPGADVELTATSGRWTGLAAGYGLLATRTVSVEATGRGAAARPRRTTLTLPTTAGDPPARPALVPLPTTTPLPTDHALPASSPLPATGLPHPAGRTSSTSGPLLPADRAFPTSGPPHPAGRTSSTSGPLLPAERAFPTAGPPHPAGRTSPASGPLLPAERAFPTSGAPHPADRALPSSDPLPADGAFPVAAEAV